MVDDTGEKGNKHWHLVLYQIHWGWGGGLSFLKLGVQKLWKTVL